VQPLDTFRAAWILFVFFLVFFFFPHLFPRRRSSPAVLRVAGNFARALLVVTTASWCLTSLKVFNTTTVVLLFLGGIMIAWVRKRAGTSRNWLAVLQEAAIGIVCLIEGRAISRPTGARVSADHIEGSPWSRALHGKELLTAVFAVVLITSGALHFAHPLRELRLDQPEQYEVLLRGRELMLNLHAHQRPLVFPSVIATIAFISSADAMQVTRFLSPVLELFIVLAAGLLIRAGTRGAVAAIAAIYCLGTAAFQPAGNEAAVPISTMEKLEGVFRISLTRTRASPEFEIGLLCLLLTLAFLADWHGDSGGWDSLVNAACCLLVVGVVSQFLLLVCVVAAGAVLLWPVMGVMVFVLTSYGLAAYATLSGNLGVPSEVRLTLPLAAALGVGCLLGLIETKLVAPLGKAAGGLLLLACVAMAILWSRPHQLPGQCLEYENAAYETQVIADRFPRQRWAVVAPTEQLAETLGLGGYEDLAEFVEKYQDQASSPDFHIPDAPEDLFVYVEKRPFQFFSREPEIVPLGVLADTTYRSYRSPAGRASLESAALRLCESYRQSHDDADVFFEDEDFRIYHIHRQRAPDTERGDATPSDRTYRAFCVAICSWLKSAVSNFSSFRP
jgi:hypothetical protein